MGNLGFTGGIGEEDDGPSNRPSKPSSKPSSKLSSKASSKGPSKDSSNGLSKDILERILREGSQLRERTHLIIGSRTQLGSRS